MGRLTLSTWLKYQTEHYVCSQKMYVMHNSHVIALGMMNKNKINKLATHETSDFDMQNEMNYQYNVNTIYK